MSKKITLKEKMPEQLEREIFLIEERLMSFPEEEDLIVLETLLMEKKREYIFLESENIL